MQMLQRLPIVLVQVKVGNLSDELLGSDYLLKFKVK